MVMRLFVLSMKQNLRSFLGRPPHGFAQHTKGERFSFCPFGVRARLRFDSAGNGLIPLADSRLPSWSNRQTFPSGEGLVCRVFSGVRLAIGTLVRPSMPVCVHYAHDSFFLRGTRLKHRGEPHKLIQDGAIPSPATNFSSKNQQPRVAAIRLSHVLRCRVSSRYTIGLSLFFKRLGFNPNTPGCWTVFDISPLLSNVVSPANVTV